MVPSSSAVYEAVVVGHVPGSELYFLNPYEVVSQPERSSWQSIAGFWFSFEGLSGAPVTETDGGPLSIFSHQSSNTW